MSVRLVSVSDVGQTDLSSLCKLPRLQSQRYDLGLELSDEDTGGKTYLSLMEKFTPKTLSRPYALIKEKLSEISRYADYLYGQLGESLSAWQQTLSEIRKTRLTFDNSESSQDFGVRAINYKQVQAKVNAKCDMWLLAKRCTHLKRKVKNWEPDIEIFEGVDQIKGECNGFDKSINCKNPAIQDQLAGLQMKIVAEDKVVQSKIEVLLADWDKEKPINEYKLVCRAKEALDLEHISNDRLDPVAEETSDLKAVWTAPSGIWSQLAKLCETTWSSVTPRKLRQSLESLLGNTREMPSRMRQCQAFEFVQDRIKFHQKSVALVGELKSDVLRERYLKLLYKNLRLSGHHAPSGLVTSLREAVFL
ncbi:hypothetical protein MJO28_013746 [Puccinia striiformis f. sp. tritici]|uniref:Dynein heavy chain linker domain-containing protein n=2 Tax=Puccinia striiformis f. sp. tritici TaxID=168172 RepID=A0A0L0UVP5_9BASI|nr:hypothetical protein MJO28_013746 [Puccinia striiformis f. sp. tritici]KNE90824.1 hypothetical protein PSTG_15738 [Puccinia striiformis f. sp. tritici PST-78]